MANKALPAELITNNQPVSHRGFTRLLSSLKQYHQGSIPAAQGRLARAIRLLKENQDALAATYSQYLGFRSPVNTLTSGQKTGLSPVQACHRDG